MKRPDWSQLKVECAIPFLLWKATLAQFIKVILWSLFSFLTFSKIVCNRKSTYNETLQAFCHVDEVFGEIRNARGKFKYLLAKAEAEPCTDESQKAALYLLKGLFNSFGTTTKTKLDRQLLKTVEAMSVKFTKDKQLLLKLTDAGITGDQCLPWTNQPLVYSVFIYMLQFFRKHRSAP